MAYHDLKLGEIDTSIIYVSKKELLSMCDISSGAMCNHINENVIDAYRFKHRTYFLPEDAKRYVELVNRGFLGTKHFKN